MLLKILCSLVLFIPTAYAQIPVKISLGYHIDPCQAPILYALHKGIFKRNGLDLEIMTASGGEEASRAVSMKKADIGITKLANHIIRISKGMPLKRSGTLVPQTLEILMIRQEIGDVKNLKDKRIGYSTSNPAFTMSIIEKVLLSQDIKLHEVTLIAFQSGLARALATGVIDAAFTVTNPYETIFMQEYKVDTITYRYQDFGIPEFPQFIFFVHQDNKDAPFIPLFHTCLQEALLEIKKSPREAWQFLCDKYPELDNKLNYRVFLSLLPLFEETPAMFDIEGTQKLLDFISIATFEGEKILQKDISIDAL